MRLIQRKNLSVFILFLLFCFAFFLRTYFCYDNVFSDPIKYSSDDGVYYMRLVENELLGGHFPYRTKFDAYTYFPYGMYHNMPFLFSKIITLIVWIVSLGKPTKEIIDKIAPFYPAFLGSLVIFPIYFISKTIWNKKIGIFSAFLVSFSGPFLFKSMLGVADHHVAEVLFSSLVMMFLVFILKIKPEGKLFSISNKKLWLWTVLAGFFLGLYSLSFNGALIFLLIIYIFILVYYLTEYLLSRNQKWVLVSGAVMFFIPFLMIGLTHDQNFYLHKIFLESTILGIITFLILAISGRVVEKKSMPRRDIVFLSLSMGAMLPFLLRVFFSDFFNNLIIGFSSINTSTLPYKYPIVFVSEMHPLRLCGFYSNFVFFGFLSLAALATIIYKFIKDKKPEYLLIVIWTIIILLMTGIIPYLGQRRYGYYLSCNISILSSFLIITGIQYSWRNIKKPEGGRNPSLRLMGCLIMLVFLIIIPFYPFPVGPNGLLSFEKPILLENTLSIIKNSPPRAEDDLYEALKWLEENTPDPGIDYFTFYQEPRINKETKKPEPYPYPKSAYGVLARWDIGHMITYYAHRIPNANNFQQGIGVIENDKVKEMGEVIFFTETEENKAINYLENLKTRYIITDYQSADPLNGIFTSKVGLAQKKISDYFINNSTTTNPDKFENSMIVKMHILDGREKLVEKKIDDQDVKFFINSLDHFRLVYESKEKKDYPMGLEEKVAIVKIFEYVKGARITGKTSPNIEIVLSTQIKTNQERKFTYQKTVKTSTDGYFEFVVPYSTFGKEGRLFNQTQFDCFADSYKLKIKDKEIGINVSEKDVLEGELLEVSN